MTIRIDGMTCGGCVAAVERALRAIDGVHKVKVSLDEKQATIEYAPERVEAGRLRSAIEDAGYEPSA
jgi:copper ion binding protein